MLDTLELPPVTDKRRGRKPDPERQPAETGSKQIAFRAPHPLAKRLENTAERLGLDPSGLLRMMMLECLPLYEQRADRIDRGEGPMPSSADA